MSTAVSTIQPCARCGQRNRVPAAAAGTPRCGHCKGPLPWLAEAGDTDFATVAEASRLPVLVDFWAPWCGPCRAVSPVLERLAGELPGELKLVKVNVDEAPMLAQRFQVRAVPTLVVLHDGKVVARRAGAAPHPILRSWLHDAIGRRTP